MISTRFRSRMAGVMLAVTVLSAATTAMAESSAATPPAPLPVAGLAPFQRPEGAPRIAVAPPRDAAGGSALHGVSQPVPPSLKFLHDQGNWYSPFDQPGAPGPYDIRGWHANPPTARKH